MKKQQKQRQLQSSKRPSQVHFIEEAQELITAAGVEGSAEALMEARALFESAMGRWLQNDNPPQLLNTTAPIKIIRGLQVGLTDVDELTDLIEAWEGYLKDFLYSNDLQKPILEKGAANMIIRSRFRAQAVCEFANQVYDAVAALVVLCDIQAKLPDSVFRSADDVGYNGSDGAVPLIVPQLLGNMVSRAERILLRRAIAIIGAFHQMMCEANEEANYNLDEIEDAFWGWDDDD